MVDEEKEVSGEEEEAVEPQSKYERIMLAAAEAARLNEEMRRKGIKIEGKIAIEAIRRVDEGKVKAVFPEKPATPAPAFAPPAEAPQDTLFLDQPPVKEEDEPTVKEKDEPTEEAETKSQEKDKE
jgi:hypothetical protein